MLPAMIRRILPLLLLLPACAATHPVRTVGQGNLGLEASLGGPLTTNLGAPVPMPSVFVGGSYGLRDDLDVCASYNVFAPISPGLGLDLSASLHWVPLQPQERGWSAGGRLGFDLLTDFQSGPMLFPWIDLAAGHRLGKVEPFVGFNLAAHAYRPYDRRHPIMLSPYLGAEVRLGEHSAVVLRLAAMDTTYNSFGSGVDWVYLFRDEDARRAAAVLTPSIGFSWDLSGGGEP